MDLSVLKKWNPWWAYGSVPEEKVGVPRQELLDMVYGLVEAKEVVGITGVRRGGKSTILHQVIGRLLADGVAPENILYFNFDEPLETEGVKILDVVYGGFLELKNPDGRQYLFFDEIQNIGGWERWVKTRYDNEGGKIKFFVTGSNTSMLSDSLSTLLTGRIFSKEVYPLSFKEYLSFKKFGAGDLDLQRERVMHYLGEYMEYGGFPEAVLEENSEINRQRLREYFNSILFRGIVATRQVKESARLAELSQYLATNLATAFSYNKISKAIGLNINTMKEYIHYLHQAYLVFQANHFSHSLKESLALQKPKKTYFIDNGMRNAVAARFTKDEGRLAENLVYLELKRRGFEIHFWKGKNEVDFVTRSPAGGITAINVTYGEKTDAREKRGLIEFREKFKKADVLIITRNEEKEEDEIKHTPLWKWLLEDNN